MALNVTIYCNTTATIYSEYGQNKTCSALCLLNCLKLLGLEKQVLTPPFTLYAGEITILEGHFLSGTWLSPDRLTRMFKDLIS